MMQCPTYPRSNRKLTKLLGKTGIPDHKLTAIVVAWSLPPKPT